MPKYTKTEVSQSLEYLRKVVKPGDKIYCILRSVSRSGTTRQISLYVIHEGVPFSLDHAAAVALGWSEGSSGVKVDGYGMEPGSHLVMHLARALFRDSGFTCIGEGCPSNDHRNGDRDFSPHLHSDPGYALRREWL